jgi:hypothetical protein
MSRYGLASLILMMVILMGSALFAPTVYASSNTVYVAGSTWGSQSSPISVEPGSTNAPFSVYIANPNTASITNVFVTLNLSYPFSSPIRGVTEDGVTRVTANTSFISPTGSQPVIFYLNIAANSSDGVYVVPATVNYTLSGVNYTFTASLQMPVTTYADLRAQNAYWGSPAAPSLASSGLRNGNLVLNVQNLGDNTAFNSSITIYPSTPFYYSSPSETAYLGVVPAGSVVPAQFTLSIDANTTTGLYPLNVSIRYNNGMVSSQIVSVPVSGAADVIVQGYGVGQPGMFPGNQNVPISIDLMNSGNITANNVRVSLGAQSPIEAAYPGSTSIEIGSMPPGEPIPTTFYVDVSSAASSPLSFKVPVYVYYGGENYTYMIPLEVNSQANFSATYYNNAYLSQGASNTKLALLIQNLGNTTAKSAQAELLLPNELSGTTVDYLGDMQNAASNIATFSIAVSSSAPPGTYYGTLVVTWFQSNAPGSQFTQEIPISFQVHQGIYTIFISWIYDFGWIVIALVAILVAVIIILVLRRRR